MPVQVFRLVAGNWIPNGTNVVTVTAIGSMTSKLGVSNAAWLTPTAVDSDPSVTAFAWSATGLPSGLAIAVGTGVVSGSPTTVGTYSVTVTATDPSGAADSATFAWAVSVNSTVTVTNPGLQTSTAGTAAVSLTMFASDSDPAITTFSWSATGLPAGTVISAATGKITGTPITVGSTSTKVTASDGASSGSATFTWTVSAAGAIRFAGDPGVGRFYLGQRYYADDAQAWITAKSPGLNMSTERCGYSAGYTAGGLFGTTGTGPGLRTDVAGIWARGRIAQMSSSQGVFSYAELGGNVPASLAAVNAAIDADIAWLRANTSPSKILWWSGQHEPDCSGVVVTDYANFRDAYYYTAKRMKDAGLPYVAFVKPYFCGALWGKLTFDWRLYDPEWTGTAWRASVYDAWGTDWYNPRVGAVTRNEYDEVTATDFWQRMTAELPNDKRPLIVGEMGIKSHDTVADPNAYGGSRSVTLNELFRDLNDYSVNGHPVLWPGKQVCSYDLWNSQPTGSTPTMADYPRVTAGGAYKSTASNALNPNGWPDSGYNVYDDPDGVELIFTGTITAGTYTLVYTPPGGGTQTTTAVAYNAAPATVIAALNALAGIATADVYINGTWNRAGATLPLTIHWLKTGTKYATEVSIAVGTSSLTGGTVAAQHTNKRGAIAAQIATKAGRTTHVKVFGAVPGSTYA